jgi:hypothetical protein
MLPSTAIIGLHPDELRWVRLLVTLMRHPDPCTPELVRQALLYIAEVAPAGAVPGSGDGAHPEARPPARPILPRSG